MVGIVKGCGQQKNYEEWMDRLGLEHVVIDEKSDYSVIDIVVFCGGPDLGVDAERDETDRRVYEICRNRRLPMLGICRGMQEIAVMMGSRLIDDLGERNGTHQADGDNSRFHEMRLSNGRTMRVNSRHHQAVEDEPFECTIKGVSEDGVNELFYSGSMGVLLVQGHPERMDVAGSDFERMCGEFLRMFLG